MAYIVSDGEHTVSVDISKLETRPHDVLYEVTLDGAEEVVSISRISPTHLSILRDGVSYNVEVERFEGEYQVTVRGELYSFRVSDEREISSTEGESVSGVQRISAPMPSLVVDVGVSVGDRVETGQSLLVLEAMKMQNDIESPASGVVKVVSVAPGDTVNSGDVLLEIEA